MSTWIKASACSFGDCIEVSRIGRHVFIRDSKNPDFTPLAFTTDEWEAFVAGIKAGEFDLPQETP